jgi:hypothetical protein
MALPAVPAVIAWITVSNVAEPGSDIARNA